MESPVVAVVGGGLAGASAALTLCDLGFTPLLFERSSSLGGRAGSHPDRTGRILDLGQHVYLGCCTEYRALLRRLGTESAAPLAARVDFTVIDGSTGRVARLAGPPLPHPLSLAGALLRYGHLSPGERLRNLALVREARRDHERGLGHDHTFAEWLRRRRVPRTSVEALWEPLVLAALNAPPERVSAAAALMVIAEGLLGGARSAAAGIPRVPLSQLVAPLAERLAPRGRVRLGVAVERVLPADDGGAAGILLASGEALRCDAVIVATSHLDVPRLLPEPWRNHGFVQNLKNLSPRPIVNVHLWYDRPPLLSPAVCVIRSPLQWLFDATALQGEPEEEGHHVVVSLSGAEEPMRRPAAELVALCHGEIARTLPRAARARLLDHAVRKVRHATFDCSPGSERLRPENRTPVPRLYLAGDYTRTGWPSTMESAVRSGRQAALAAAHDLGRRTSLRRAAMR